MANQMVQDRLDIPIWNAIEASNYKQALKLVDKRLAKKHTDYLEALKIFIRAKSPDLSEKVAVITHLEELPLRKAAFKDLETIQLYEEAFGDILPEPQESWPKVIGEIRWQCVKSFPKNEYLSKDCFKECLAKNDIDHARQIANSLEKSFPSNHAYIFWNIATMSLYSETPNYPENQRKLWGSLAWAQIQKLAAATRTAPDQKKLPVRSIHTAQELLLLHRIAGKLGKPEQRLDYLQDPNLGRESVVAKGEWQLWRFELSLLTTAQEWQKLFDTTQALLKRARTKDDSGQLSESGFSDCIIWEAYIRSAIELQGHENEVLAEFSAHLDPDAGVDKSWRRNASLAKLKYAFESQAPFALESSTSPGRIKELREYLTVYGSATTAYNDLKPFVEKLKVDEKKTLLEAILKNRIFGDPVADRESYKTARKLTEHINVYKLRYLLSFSIPANVRQQIPVQHVTPKEFTCPVCSNTRLQHCSSCIQAYAKDAAKLYLMSVEGGREAWKLLTTDRHPADDLAVLASICLILLPEDNDDAATEPLSSAKNSRMLQAAALLEYAATFSQSNFQIWLLLIRIYRFLGCGLMAMKAYDNLALKQIQLDTLSYTLFDRMSSFHPQAFGLLQDTQFKSPIESIKKHQKLYKGAGSQIAQQAWVSYKNGSYNTIFELREVMEKLGCTMAMVMSVTESSKINRLVRPKEANQAADILPAGFDSADSKIYDTNDYKTFPNFETTAGYTFEEMTRSMPAPSDFRTRVDLNSYRLIKLLSQDPTSPESQVYLGEMLVSKPTRPNSGVMSHCLTTPEEWALICYEDMTLIITSALDPLQWNDDNFTTSLESYNKDLIERLENLPTAFGSNTGSTPALGSQLHTLYTMYDLTLTLLAFTKFLTSKGKAVHTSQTSYTTQIHTLALSLQRNVSENVAVVKKGMDEGGWIDKVLEAVNGVKEPTLVGNLEDMMDAAQMEVWAGDLVEGWKESVEGLSGLKFCE